MQETRIRSQGLIPGSGKSPGEGNGCPLPYSCLRNPMDRGAWWVAVHGAARVGHDWVTKPPPFFSAFPWMVFRPLSILVFLFWTYADMVMILWRSGALEGYSISLLWYDLSKIKQDWCRLFDTLLLQLASHELFFHIILSLSLSDWTKLAVN